MFFCEASWIAVFLAFVFILYATILFLKDRAETNRKILANTPIDKSRYGYKFKAWSSDKNSLIRLIANFLVPHDSFVPIRFLWLYFIALLPFAIALS